MADTENTEICGALSLPTAHVEECVHPIGTVLSPTTIDGVLQFRIVLDPSSVPKNLYREPLRTRYESCQKDLAENWPEYSSKKLWSMPDLQKKRISLPLYEIPSSEAELDVESILNTAVELRRISRNDADLLAAQWRASSAKPVDFLNSCHALFKLHLWRIHYIDWYLRFLDIAVEYQYLTKEQRTLRREVLLALPDAIPLEGLTVKDITDSLLSEAPPGDPDKRWFGKTDGIVEEQSILVDGHPIRIHKQKALEEDLKEIAKSRNQLYIAPDFGYGIIESLRFIKLNDLEKENVPDLIVEGLISVASYPGRLGDGNIVKTHSLFPGEKAVITIETFSKETIKEDMTSSVLDSVNRQSETSLTEEINAEDRYNKVIKRTSSFSVGTKATGNWGWGSANLSTENDHAAENISKSAVTNINKALKRQTAQVSNKRTVKVETNNSYYAEESSKQSIVRTIENINVSRPLNFVFRQLCQLYFTLTTIKDLRIVFRLSPAEIEGVVASLQELPEMLQAILEDNAAGKKKVQQIYDKVVQVAKDMAEQKDEDGSKAKFVVESNIESLIVEKRFRINEDLINFYRWESDPESTNHAPATAAKMAMDLSMFPAKTILPYEGVLLREELNILKTDGVVVECFLSHCSEGLDEYSAHLQAETNKRRCLENAVLQEKALQMRLAREIVAEKDATKAELFEKLVSSMRGGSGDVLPRSEEEPEGND